MKSLLTLLISVVFLFTLISNSFSQENKIEPTWESINAREYPQWFSDAKLGIFIHWGLYSVPSWSGKEQYAEWYLRGLQSNDTARIDFQKKVFGENFTYRDYAPLFKAELFNSDEWANLFKKSGAGYVLLVSKHHDGYCLWPSEYAKNWNSVDVGPKRDLVGELTNSVRNSGLKMGLYYSLPEWNNKLFRWYTDPNDQVTPYVDQHMIPQFKELISTYKPEVLFTDGEWFHSADTWHAKELISWYYNTVGKTAIVNNRWGGGSNTGFLTPEYSSGINVTDRPWAECRGIGRSFGLNRNETIEAYMSPDELIHFFVKAVANGGGIILNVGPKADGQIPLLQQERLLQLGEWLEVNGEAIYASKAWNKQGEEKEVVLERIDKEINFNWVRNTPGQPIKEDKFSAEWNGFIKPDVSGNFTFEAEVDDAMRLWIDGKLVINKWSEENSDAEGNVQGREIAVSDKGNLKLKAEVKYPIKIEYFEDKQNAHIRLYWSAKKLAKQIIPTTNLYTDINKENGDGLNAKYKSMQQYLAYTTNNDNVYAITLEWPDEELVLSIPNLSLNSKVNLLGYDKDLKWYYKDGKMFIDVSEIKYNDMPCKYAWTFKISKGTEE